MADPTNFLDYLLPRGVRKVLTGASVAACLLGSLLAGARVLVSVLSSLTSFALTDMRRRLYYTIAPLSRYHRPLFVRWLACVCLTGTRAGLDRASREIWWTQATCET